MALVEVTWRQKRVIRKVVNEVGNDWARASWEAHGDLAPLADLLLNLPCHDLATGKVRTYEASVGGYDALAEVIARLEDRGDSVSIAAAVKLREGTGVELI